MVAPVAGDRPHAAAAGAVATNRAANRKTNRGGGEQTRGDSIWVRGPRGGAPRDAGAVLQPPSNSDARRVLAPTTASSTSSPTSERTDRVEEHVGALDRKVRAWAGRVVEKRHHFRVAVTPSQTRVSRRTMPSKAHETRRVHPLWLRAGAVSSSVASPLTGSAASVDSTTNGSDRWLTNMRRVCKRKGREQRAVEVG